MLKTIAVAIVVTLAARAQRIETEKSDRHTVLRVGTAPNHLSIIELADPVTEVGAAALVRPRIAGAPLLEIRGTITEVRISPGRGMPSLVVKDDSEESVLLLGSMRYLMAQDFNPKVGDEVVAKAYKTSNGLLAVSVTLPQTKKTIRLREESGRPLWRGPRW